MRTRTNQKQFPLQATVESLGILCQGLLLDGPAGQKTRLGSSLKGAWLEFASYARLTGRKNSVLEAVMLRPLLQ